MPYPSALAGNPKCIFFTDFDGTITMQDSNDYLTDNLGFGQERRRQLNLAVLEGRASFRDTFREMLDSVKAPFPDCIQTLCANIKLDPGFKNFYRWATANDVPVIVLSSGMVPIIRALLAHLLGPEADGIEIVANDVRDRPGKTREQEGGWEIVFHDDSHFGHDKSLAIRPYAEHVAKMAENERPTLLYAGDGVSDLSAARETDLLFAKKGHDLVSYCEREHVPFTVFEDWRSIMVTTRDIVLLIMPSPLNSKGVTNVPKVAAEGAEDPQIDVTNEVKTTK